MTKVDLISIASLVRSAVKGWVQDNLSVDIMDLTGACAIASYALWRVLLAQGYKVTFVCIDEGNFGHCWVECEDLNILVDITATQFGGPEVAIYPPTKPPTWTSQLPRGKRRINECALAHLQKNWDEQSPHPYEGHVDDLLYGLGCEINAGLAPARAS